MLGLSSGEGRQESYRLLTKELIRVSVVAEFKKSFIGLSWMILSPLFVVISWVVLHSAGIIAPGDIDVPYPVYVLVGTSVWFFFVSVFNDISGIITSNSRLLLAADFPVIILLIKALVVQLIHFSITIVLNLLVILLFGVKLHWIGLLFPLSLIPLVFFAAGLGLITAMFRVVAIDLAKVIDHGIRFLMFLTPVVYSTHLPIEWLKSIIWLNPLTYYISMPRDLLLAGQLFEPINYLWCSIAAFLFFFFSYRFFRKICRTLLERIINN